jgi:hypothetical protein
MKHPTFRLSLLLLMMFFHSFAMSQVVIRNIRFYSKRLVGTADNINNSGTVKQLRDTYYYLSVSQNYVKNLYPILTQELRRTDPRDLHCLRYDDQPIGAHISLYYNHYLDEAQRRSFIGQHYRFKVKGIEEFVIRMQPGDMYWHWYTVRVTSPKLLHKLAEFTPAVLAHQPILHISFAVAEKKDGKCQRRS